MARMSRRGSRDDLVSSFYSSLPPIASVTSHVRHNSQYELLNREELGDDDSNEALSWRKRISRPSVKIPLGWKLFILVVCVLSVLNLAVWMKGGRSNHAQDVDPKDVVYAELFRNAASFWKVEEEIVDDDFVIWIKPVRADMRVAAGILDQAVFSARLLSPFNDPSFIRSLPPPELHKDFHTYRLVIPSHLPRLPLAFASSNLTLELKLEFGHYPFDHGRVCPGATCTPAQLCDIASSSSKPQYSGKFVQAAGGTNLSFSFSEERSVGESKTACRDYSNLPGSWIDKTYVPDECDLPLPNRDLLQQAAISKLPSNSVAWVHFVGDSVVRTGRRTVMEKLGMNWSSYNSTPSKWGLTHDLGVVKLEGNRTLVITYRAWFRCDRIEKYQDACSMNLLDSVINPNSFEEVFDLSKGYTKLPFDFTTPLGPPDKIYLSMGAHSVYMMEEGFKEFWKKATPILNRAKNLSLLLHTFVDSSIIPKKFGPQSLLRNNYYITWLNKELRTWAEENEVRLVDWEGISSGAVGSLYRDAVHPIRQVFEALYLAAIGDWYNDGGTTGYRVV